jgi:hypothetical protein
VWKASGEGSFTGDPEIYVKRYIKRDVKMPCKRVSLSVVVLLGNLEGIRLLGLSWTQRTLRF